MVDNSEFIEWLEREMKERGMNQSELARRGGITRSAVSKLLNHQQKKPGVAMLEAIARAFNIPASQVFRAAGIVEQVSEEHSLLDELSYLVNKLSDDELREVIDYARHRLEKQEAKASQKTSSRSKRPARIASAKN